MQNVAGQQQEIKRLLQKKTAVDEQDSALTKELTTLRAELDNKNRQLEVGETDFQWQRGPPGPKSLFSAT